MTGEKLTLPSGAWIELRAAEITERQRRSVQVIVGRLSSAVKETFVASGADTGPEAIAGVATEADLAAMFALNDAVAAAMIASWSFDGPVSADALLDLPSSDYDAIQTATAPYVGLFMGLDTSISIDPDSPT